MRAHCWGKMIFALFLVVSLASPLVAQEAMWQGQKDHPMLRVTLKDKDKNAQKHAALVEVETQNIALVDFSISSYGGSDMGLLEYQVDQGPVFTTNDTQVMFRNLMSGKHTITVSLVNLDYKDLGARAECEIDVP